MRSEAEVHPPAMIVTENLSRVYSVGAVKVPALRGINLRIEGGQFVALEGRSGSGKTTLLNCLGGLDFPTSGEVHVLGQNLRTMADQDLTRWRREQVGFVFQSFGLLPTLSAYENVELVLRLRRASPSLRHRQTLASLELAGVGQWSHHRPYELSGGQQQRVAIARALVNQPRLILADEPTGELDSVTAREVLALFRRLVDETHVTLLMVSHDPLAMEYADQTLQLRDGLIVEP